MKCKICGKEIDSSHYSNRDEMETHQMCFNCNFWRDMLEEDAKRPPHTHCMIDGTHYVIGDEDSKSYFRGFGGAKFQIEFNDGHRVVTTNLWCQGNPEGYWKEKFPDNAKFERNLKWKKIGECSYLTEDEQ